MMTFGSLLQFDPVLLVCLLSIAALYDLRYRRVPNVLSAAVLVGGLASYANIGSALSGVGAAAITLAGLFVPWSLGGVGGGDVKLAAATASWFGVRHLPSFLIATALAGGLVAVAAYLGSRDTARRDISRNLWAALATRRWPLVNTGGSGRVSVPYALAVGAGALFTLTAG